MELKHEKNRLPIIFLCCIRFSFHQDCLYTAEIDTLVIKDIVIQKSLHNHLFADASKLDSRGSRSRDNTHEFTSNFSNYDEVYKKLVRVLMKHYKDKVKYWIVFCVVNVMNHIVYMVGGAILHLGDNR